MQKDLFIIIYSPLKTHGGGIESWLIKFLTFSERLYEVYKNIYIIGIASDKEELISDIIQNDKIYFLFLDIGVKPAFLKILDFVLKTKNFLSKKIKERNVDVDFLSIGTIYAAIPAYLIQKRYKFKIRKIIWLRSIFFKSINVMKLRKIKKIAFFIEEKCLKEADIIIANGFDTRDAYQKRYNLININVIPNAINISSVKENFCPFSNEKIRIGYIGRFFMDKGITSFMESIEKYNQKNTNNNKEFIFIGWGGEEERVFALANKYENVKYIGKLENTSIFEELKCLDATVHLTTSGIIGGGGISNSLLESIFANNLVICWNNSIYRQVVNETNACLLPENDALALVNIYYELDNRENMIAKIENAKKLKPDYLFSEHIEKFISLVRECNIS
jgi:hypothetical protein